MTLIKTRLENNIKELKEVMKEEDIEGVEELTDKLNGTWQEISTKLYQQTEQTETPQESPKEDATDVEYEEVK